jgi:hypothetical protein
MLPGHCKDVAVKVVDFPLTKDNIDRAIVGKKAYTRCDHYILVNHKDRAVVRIVKKEGKELFRDIIEHQILALPQDIVFVQDACVDVLNRPQMALMMKAHPGKVVVVQGMFEHISFVQPGEVLDLYVLDTVPPRPSKLSVLVGRAMAAGLIDLPIVPVFEEIDVQKLGLGVETPAVLFPCEASGLTSSKETYYLDQMPAIDKEVTMVGCDLSERIYRSRYHGQIERIEMCPRELAPKDGRKRLVKCCRVRNGHEIEGDLAIVPWGATVMEVAAAITALFGEPL